MIKKYKNVDGQWLYKISWVARGVTNPEIRHRRQKAGIQTLAEAQRLEKQLMIRVQREVVEKETKGQWLRIVIEKWFSHTMATKVASGEVGAKLVIDDRGTLLYWLKKYSTLPAGMLTTYMVQEIVREKLAKGISLSQVKHFRRMLRHLYEFAIAYKWVPKDTPIPLPIIKNPRKGDVSPEILNTDEIMRLVSEAYQRQNPWRHVWAMALLTGMRSGELKALLWDDVDFDNRIIRVSKSVEGRTLIVKTTKAGYWRDVPISDELKKLLDELKLITHQEGNVLPRVHGWDSNRQAFMLRSFCQEIGMTSIRFHTLRACFATQLLRQGVEAAKVMKVCGWRDLATMQRYVRLAGIEVSGITDGLKIFQEENLPRKLVAIRRFSS